MDNGIRSIVILAIVVSAVVGGVLFLVIILGGLWAPHWVALAVIAVIGVYYFVKYAVASIIDSRIKPLYLFITAKEIKKRSVVGGFNKSIALLEGELKVWAERSKHEMDTLRTMEHYRKEFLGNVSHELKTPLFSLQGYIDTLRAGAVDDKEVRTKYLARCDKNVERLINIVRDLEEISRLESDTMVLYRTNFDIGALILEVYYSLETLFVEYGVEMRALPREVYIVNADRSRVEQVVVNLLSNALKYNKRGGSVEVRLVDMFDSVTVSVEDCGVGISSEHLPRLFERFYRVDKGRSRDAGGTGLGLAIVKHILEAHGQSITVRSTLGVGTVFLFTLPKAK